VVAEGVEDDQQRVALRVMGCDDAQGYHYSRPLPADEFAAWMASRVSDRPANALGFG
jgi:EAL domain-containing protein (putative c-di-GMP-specific phosphodiesterase class I)